MGQSLIAAGEGPSLGEGLLAGFGLGDGVLGGLSRLVRSGLLGRELLAFGFGFLDWVADGGLGRGLSRGVGFGELSRVFFPLLFCCLICQFLLMFCLGPMW